VIIDPVAGDSPFFTDIDECRRLVNVAISRAQARVILLLSQEDCRNPVLADLWRRIDPGRFPGVPASNQRATRTAAFDPDEAVDICTLVGHPDFPRSAMNRVVYIKDIVGRITKVDGKSKFTVTTMQPKKDRVFVSSDVKAACGKKSHAL
jgi:hypothetical protein